MLETAGTPMATGSTVNVSAFDVWFDGVTTRIAALTASLKNAASIVTRISVALTTVPGSLVLFHVA
jgi:hypothetical protein